jgi:hypothetical protein
MPGTYPVGRSAYYDPMLSRFASMAFRKEGGSFIADQVAPAIPVEKQSGLYRVFDPDPWLRIPQDLRAPRAVPGRVSFTTGSATYFCPNRALGADIALEDVANADTAIRVRENHADLVVTQLKRAQEFRVAQLMTSSGGPQTIVSGAWTASTDILGQVNSAHTAIWNLTGMRPNAVIIDWQSINEVRRNATLLELFKYTSGGELPDQRLRDDVFKVGRMITADAIYNSAKEGQSMSNSGIWGRICLFAYIDPSAPSDMSPNFVTRFRWNPPELPYKTGAGDTLDLAVFRSVYDKAGEPKIEVLEAGYYQSEQISGRPLSYLIKTA